jgi:hypothetical protein
VQRASLWLAFLGFLFADAVCASPVEVPIGWRAAPPMHPESTSIGGNDALQNSDLLSLGLRSTAHALEVLADRVTAFERANRTGMKKAASLERQTAVCPIYNGASVLGGDHPP